MFRLTLSLPRRPVLHFLTRLEELLKTIGYIELETYFAMQLENKNINEYSRDTAVHFEKSQLNSIFEKSHLSLRIINKSFVC